MKFDFSRRLKWMEFSHQICSCRYHITSGTWILPYISSRFHSISKILLLLRTKKPKSPQTHWKTITLNLRKDPILAIFFRKVNLQVGVRNFRWIRNITWRNTNTSQFFEYTWMFRFAYWLNSKVKANESGHWNSSIFWTFGTSLYECAHLWFWLIKAFKYLAFYLEICQPFLKSFNLGRGKIDWNNNKISANKFKYQDYFLFTGCQQIL